ncbi:MAG: hypothetical protein ACHRHE_10345 [Tepidisphaerales bacterium]
MFIVVFLALTTPARADGPILPYVIIPGPLLPDSSVVLVTSTPRQVWAIDRSDTWQLLREDADLSARLRQWENSRSWLLSMSSSHLPARTDAIGPILMDSGTLRMPEVTIPLPHVGGAVVDSSVVYSVCGSGPRATVLAGTTIGQAVGDLLSVGATPIDPTPVIPLAILRHADLYTLRFHTPSADTIELTARFQLTGESREAALQRGRDSNTVESVRVVPDQVRLPLGGGSQQLFGGILRQTVVPDPDTPPTRWFRFDLPNGG